MKTSGSERKNTLGGVNSRLGIAEGKIKKRFNWNRQQYKLSGEKIRKQLDSDLLDNFKGSTIHATGVFKDARDPKTEKHSICEKMWLKKL